MSLRRLSRPLGLALSGLLATAALALVPATAQARVSAPSGLAPAGPTSSSTPTFTWNRVAGATQYDLVISAGGNAIAQTTTANNRFVPTSNLPDGDITWQVRADTPAGNSSWASADANISSTAAPSPVAPVGGTLLTQPDNPPLFSWSAVSGAAGYELQVDNSGSWTSPTTYLPHGTSYYVDLPQSPGTWYWRVRADRGSGLYTAWSSTATYDVGQLDDPQPGADMTGNPTLQDVSLDWQPVPGATKYQLQVGKDPDFNNLVDNTTWTVYGTRFQRNQTYANGGYYWRVRAVDAAGTPMPWTSAVPFSFQRNWPQKPTLEWPLNQFAPPVGNPMFYQWTPVRRASEYQLDVGSDPNFSPNTYVTCYASSTTYPVNGNCGALGQGQTTYWRVKAIDQYVSGNQYVEGIYSDIHHFVYSSGQINQTSPANGDTVDVPTLAWDPIGGTQTYHVVITDQNNNIAASTDTSSTTWTPETALPTSGNPYTWTVQSTPYTGNMSPLYPGSTFNVSGNTPAAGTPLVPITGVSGDPATAEFPELTWGDQPGATYYKIRIGVVGSGFYDPVTTSHINGTNYPYAAATDTGTHYLSPGNYFWYVDAYDASNHLLGETSPADYGRFTIKDLPAASGQKVALDGLASLSGSAGCSNARSNPVPANQVCTGVPATPMLSWDAQPRAAGYAVYLATDPAFTTRVVNPYALTTNTVWTPPSDLPDNTTSGAYYWYVRPCKSMNPLQCNPDPISTNEVATNAFRKLSPAIQLGSPANGASLTSDPTFSWSDYYDTNQGVSYAGGDDPSYQTALAYHVQIANASTFAQATIVADTTVDQPFYTPSNLTLPQGTLYWRVQAVDPGGNNVNWSSVRSFSNDQPTISLAASGAVPSPVGGVTVSGSTPFRWAPMNGASSYTIEVYKNDDSTHSPAYQVIAANVHQSAYVSKDYLPPSSSAYRWRVRWFDADGQPRPWSTDGRFFVSASSVTLTAPATGTLQKRNNLYFTWNPVPFAAKYRLDIRDANNNSVYNLDTPATANAPSLINDGVYTWRVTALDPNGGGIATSAWRTFTIDATVPVVTKVTPTPYGKPGSDLTVTFSEKVAGVTASSFQLHPYLKKSKLAAKVKLSSNGKVATLTPKAKLKKGHSYTGTVTGTIHDAAGNHLVTYSWSFQV